MTMKIRQSDYDKLQALLQETKQEYKVHSRDDYMLSATKYAWELFHITMDRLQFSGRISDYLFMRSLHYYLTDSHIETALKRITANI